MEAWMAAAHEIFVNISKNIFPMKMLFYNNKLERADKINKSL